MECVGSHSEATGVAKAYLGEAGEEGKSSCEVVQEPFAGTRALLMD